MSPDQPRNHMGMKKHAAGKQSTPAALTRKNPGSGSAPAGKIHPVVIYPFWQPADNSDLEELYKLVARLDDDREKYARPLTVMDRKTYFTMEHQKSFIDFRNQTVARCSDILDAWSVDTCQMWYTGLATAYEQGAPGDVYWLIPGDFNYGSAVGKEVLGRLRDLPEIIQELEQDICIGEITSNPTSSKQVIETYGTFTLLYNWFPAEAQEIRQFTERPRSEFFALNHRFLGEVLQQRWYAYEQTVIILLQAAMSKRRISRFFVGNISDLPEGHESLAQAIQQVERTEWVLKSFWLEKYYSKSGWPEQYRALENQSERARRTALLILQNLLGTPAPLPHFQDPLPESPPAP